MPLSFLLPLWLSAATVQPAQVPAQGRHDALVTLDAAGMVHLSARSGPGTACTVVDRVRGPFEHAGVSGRGNCELDLLLDQGTYKLRLDSPPKGKGQVKIEAKPFVELNPKPPRLSAGGKLEQKLRPGEQLSFWVSATSGTEPLFLRVTGRTAGELRLWRAGEWVESVPFAHEESRTVAAHPVHDWFLAAPLEAGDHLVTVYGARALPWSNAAGDDTLTVELGFPAAPPERALPFTLGPSGSLTVALPAEPTAALLTLKQAPAVATELSLAAADGSWSPQSRCAVQPKTLQPSCATMGSASRRLVARVRGAPGTSGLLEWAPSYLSARGWAGGYYGEATTSLSFSATTQDALVGIHDLPVDTDAPPLGCQLEKVFAKTPPEVVARDMLKLADGQQLDSEFNYGGSAVIWFEVERANRYRVATLGGRRAGCNLSRLKADGTLEVVVASKTESTCELSQLLTPGPYQLSLSGGLSGVEHLVVREDTQRALKNAPPKASCLLRTGLSGNYRLVLTRTGNLTARGLVLAPLPLGGTSPVHFTLEAGQTLTLPLSTSGELAVRAAAGAPFRCQGKDTSGAECRLSGAPELSLTNTSAGPVSYSVARPSRELERPPPQPYEAQPLPLPRAAPGTPTYFPFGAHESRSLVFDVAAPGLYEVTTLGLLATQCALRTPVAPSVAQDTGSGRGRNCLVSGYLRPGRYRTTATTVGQSQGRAALVLNRREATDFGAVAAESDAFFRVAAGALAQQRLLVKTAGEYDLSTTAQGTALACRLEDADGWPLEPVPSACTGRRTLSPGTYLWTQLPLTVESMRHTQLQRVRAPRVLEGNQPHALDFFTWYDARLGKDGSDEFRFSLEGAATVDLVLTNGMQGRLLKLEPGQSPKPIEVIPPMGGAAGASLETEGDGEREQEAEPEQPPEEDGERDGEAEGDGDGERETQTMAAGVSPLAAAKAPPPPSGFQLTLAPGQYQLIAVHSRGDVGIEYQLHLGTRELQPGMTRTLSAPSEVPLLIPRDGTLRLRTRGEVDVRCRLFDEKNRLVLEGSENGADWNCALAEPITQGRYRLVLESETQRAGDVAVSVALATVEDRGELKDGLELPLASPVAVVSIPVPAQDAVQDVTLSSGQPFSCALEDGAGTVVFRKTRSTECAVLLHPLQEKYRLRAWTTDGASKVKVAFKSRPVATGSPGALPAAGALRLEVPAPGRYRTGPAVYCLGASERGLLAPCSQETSLAQGPTLFSTRAGLSGAVALDEVLAPTGPVADAQELTLSSTAWRQTLTAPYPAVFVVEALVAPGERTAPACRFEGNGGVLESRERVCLAASAAGTRAAVRAWAPLSPDEPAPATLRRRALPVPRSSTTLTAGHQRLTWTGPAALFALPGASRVELLVPADAWAVQLDEQDRALDLCGPREGLHRCVFSGARTRVLVASAEAAVDATVLLSAPVRSTAFSGLVEEQSTEEGTLELAVAQASEPRTLVVEGASACVLVRSDGVRATGCRQSVPPAVTARLTVEHGVGPLRAALSAVGRERSALLGVDASTAQAPELGASISSPLSAPRLERTLTVSRPAAVRVRADSGVCGLFRGKELLATSGVGSGCDVTRVLPAGSYRLLVRPFAGGALTGAVAWSEEAVVPLSEGVGPEEWLGPGQVRVFQFETKGPGKVGLGLQTPSEALDCVVERDGARVLGEGCHQYLSLEQGRYLLTVRHPRGPSAAPLRFRPVLLGLQGSAADVPPEYLQDLFRRIGATP